MNSDEKYINHIITYFNILHDINRKFNIILKKGCNINPYKVESMFRDISCDIYTIMPFYRKKRTSILNYTNNGPLLIQRKKVFLYKSYNYILKFKPFNKPLKDLLLIRNKSIHEAHNLHFSYSVGSKSSQIFGLKYKGKTLNISTISLTPIIWYLNTTFEVLRKYVVSIVDRYPNYKNSLYYSELIKNSFTCKSNYHTISPQYIISSFYNKPYN